MRRPLLLLLLSAAGASGCGGSDAGRPTSTVAASDPATVACRGYRSPDRETCEGSYFQCREDTKEIVDDVDDGERLDPRTISVRYAESYWGDWDDDTRTAARTGCRSGLRR